MSENARPIQTGDEVTNGKQRGVVVEGWVRKSGPNKGTVSVMWIGDWATRAEKPEDLTRVEPK